MSGVDVTGGTHSVEVDGHRMTTLAAAFGHAAHDTLASAWHLHGYLADPDLATGALFDPAGMAAFELSLGTALDGLHGLTWAGARCELVDGEIRAAALAYEGVDSLVGTLHDAILGRLEAPVALAYFTYQLATTHDFSTAAQRTITTFPELADALVPELAAGALTLMGMPPDLHLAARSLDDGHGVFRRTGDVWGVDDSGAAGRPPRQLADVLGALAQRNDDPHHGGIDVRFLYRPDGSRKVVVDITGTKSWSLEHTSDITSLATNGRALYGDRTSYEQGVLEAMHDAGVTSTDDVMIVGHSEGGMVAVTTARDAVRTGQFTVTHVVTAGAPIGRSVGSLPRSVDVLALENTRDVVPHLDGVANPDRRNVTTARAGHGNGTVGDDHSLEHGYVPLARDVTASRDPALRDYLHSCRDYFDADSVTTKSYQIVRRY